jgi:hypothetical protein
MLCYRLINLEPVIKSYILLPPFAPHAYYVCIVFRTACVEKTIKV